MNNGTEVSDPELNKILHNIRQETKHFDNITFHHMSRRHNKRADAFATAASISAEAGKRAIMDADWDPRNNDEYSQDRMELVQRSS
jgi:predicted outer membrane protein